MLSRYSPARVKMVKLSLSSWLGSSSSSTTKMAAADAERKRENRRSFAGFSTVSSQFSNKAGSRLSTTLPRAKKSSNTPPNVAAADKNVVAKHADRASSLGGSTTNTESDVAAATTPSIAQAGVQTSSAGSTMTELAATISRETAKLEKFMRDNNLPMPSFEVSAADDFPKLPEDIQQSRLAVIHATKELRDLTVGPRESVRWGVWEVSPDILSLPHEITSDQNQQIAVHADLFVHSSSTSWPSSSSTLTIWPASSL